MLKQAKDKVAWGESTKAQDVDKRIQTQLNKLAEIAVALKGLERTAREGGDGGKLTYVLMASTSTANGVPRTVCFESRNLLQWTVEEAANLLEQAECGKWVLQQSAREREEYARTSGEMFPSYGAALQVLNTRKLRQLLTVLGYDKMRDDIKKGVIPAHMETMFSDADTYILRPYKPGQIGDERPKEGVSRGTGGRFVSDSGPVTEAESSHLTDFDAWHKQAEEPSAENQSGPGDDINAEEESTMTLKYFIQKGDDFFKISHASRRECMVAFRLLLEFKQQGHASAASPSQALCKMWELATVHPVFSTPIGNDSRGNPTVEGGAFSLEQRRAITCIVFPVKSMVCEENGTAGSSQTEKRTHPKSWVTYRSIKKDAKGGGATASKPASSTGGAGGSRTDVGNDEGSSSSSTSHPDGFGRMPPPSGGIQDDDDAQAQAAIIKDPSFQRFLKQGSYEGAHKDKTNHFLELWKGMDHAARTPFQVEQRASRIDSEIFLDTEGRGVWTCIRCSSTGEALMMHCSGSSFGCRICADCRFKGGAVVDESTGRLSYDHTCPHSADERMQCKQSGHDLLVLPDLGVGKVEFEKHGQTWGKLPDGVRPWWSIRELKHVDALKVKWKEDKHYHSDPRILIEQVYAEMDQRQVKERAQMRQDQTSSRGLGACGEKQVGNSAVGQKAASVTQAGDLDAESFHRDTAAGLAVDDLRRKEAEAEVNSGEDDEGHAAETVKMPNDEATKDKAVDKKKRKKVTQKASAEMSSSSKWKETGGQEKKKKKEKEKKKKKKISLSSDDGPLSGVEEEEEEVVDNTFQEEGGGSSSGPGQDTTVPQGGVEKSGPGSGKKKTGAKRGRDVPEMETDAEQSRISPEGRARSRRRTASGPSGVPLWSGLMPKKKPGPAPLPRQSARFSSVVKPLKKLAFGVGIAVTAVTSVTLIRDGGHGV